MSQSAMLASHMELPPPVPPRGPDLPPRGPDLPPRRRSVAPPVPAPGIEARFRFHQPDEFPEPEAMSTGTKIYPSQMANSRRERQGSGRTDAVPHSREEATTAFNVASTKKTRAPPPPPETFSTDM